MSIHIRKRGKTCEICLLSEEDAKCLADKLAENEYEASGPLSPGPGESERRFHRVVVRSERCAEIKEIVKNLFPDIAIEGP